MVSSTEYFVIDKGNTKHKLLEFIYRCKRWRWGLRGAASTQMRVLWIEAPLSNFGNFTLQMIKYKQIEINYHVYTRKLV